MATAAASVLARVEGSEPYLLPASLFEALARILALIRTEPRAAAHAIVRFGDLLRLALEGNTTLLGTSAARLNALKAQLAPHFLLNALNGVLPLLVRDPEAASRSVGRLAVLLRLSFEHHASDLIRLRSELRILRLYLEIQQTRFPDRFTAKLDVPSELGEALVPNLILQPLVENAIKHGIAARPGEGSIEVRAHRRDDRLELVVRDDGPGPPDGGRRCDTGIGLSNTRDRLRLLYADAHAFSLRRAPFRGCEAALTIPLAFES